MFIIKTYDKRRWEIFNNLTRIRDWGGEFWSQYLYYKYLSISFFFKMLSKFVSFNLSLIV